MKKAASLFGALLGLALLYAGHTVIYDWVPRLWAGTPPTPVWIVLSFEGRNGQPSQMSFNNPAVPDLTLKRCEEILPQIRDSLVEAARKRAPEHLSTAPFRKVECIASETDPIRP
ncbi:hypothetical protein [Microvirga subterranea]|uniref:Uncharacterized protein n=1 Tax=Microvirga subterranea TaxID=186651 RepID=A0A370HT42_9HYPH|nr:hypothetical protein [Microvirga subterranea]RDI60144.1 hypothetical protein DES45_103405 [Microvirga subterranea]